MMLEPRQEHNSHPAESWLSLYPEEYSDAQLSLWILVCFFVTFKIYFLLSVYMCFIYVYVHHMHTVHVEARRGHVIP